MGCNRRDIRLGPWDPSTTMWLYMHRWSVITFSIQHEKHLKNIKSISMKKKKTKKFSSVAQSCPTICDPMNHSMPGLPVHHHLPEFTQTHVRRVRDAIQPSHPWLSPSASNLQSLPTSESFPMSQLFAWGGQSPGASALASFLPKKSQGWSPSE